jgi:NAD(P)-dependent dehydrogenase (short-subunit alcohol dehydrogenase family)
LYIQTKCQEENEGARTEGKAVKGIDGRVAIVTGGANGIGAGLVLAFVAAGAKVVSADIDEEKGSAVAGGLGADCRFLRTDLRRDQDIDRLVGFAADSFGGIDFLICAACTYGDEGAQADRASWLTSFDVNLVGHVILVQRARPYLRQSSWPAIVNFTSEAAHVGLPKRWVYPATKAAIEQVTRSQAIDLAPDGVRANCVMPSWTAKPWHAEAPKEVKDHYAYWGERLHMLRRLGRLDEVTDAVLFLCSEHAGFITGSCLRVDGGHSAMGPQGWDVALPSTLQGGKRTMPSR